MEQTGFALRWACEAFGNDREVVLAAARSRGASVLDYADLSFRDDKRVLLEAAGSHWKPLRFPIHEGRHRRIRVASSRAPREGLWRQVMMGDRPLCSAIKYTMNAKIYVL